MNRCNLLRHPLARIARVVPCGIRIAVALLLVAPDAVGQERAQSPEFAAPEISAALDPWKDLPEPGVKPRGALSCASATCHGQSEEPVASQGPRRREYPTWLEHDPHARAAATLVGAKFQRILAIVSSGRSDGAAEAHVYAQCAACHDPQGHHGDGDVAVPLASRVVDHGTRGIGCESCHGAAERWLTSHYQRGTTRNDRIRSGMHDLKNVVTRGRVCAACHVGDDRHDLNHDMLAAGHPPLRFELSAYHDLIRVKHWPESERITASGFKVRLWAAGQVSVADSMLGLLASRSERAAAPRPSRPPPGIEENCGARRVTPWPEFAEYDCFACHQRLRPLADINRPGSTAVRGLPVWQPWNLGLLIRQEPSEDMRTNRTDASGASDSFTRLRHVMERRFANDPADAAPEALAMRAALRRGAWAPLGLTWQDLVGSTSVERTLVDSLERLLMLVESLPETPLDWADASQRLLALKAAYLAIRDERQRDRAQTARPLGVAQAGGSPGAADSLSSSLRRFEELSRSLGFGSREFEWPRYDWTGLPGDQPRPTYQDLNSLGLQLRSLATELRTEIRPSPKRRSEGVRGL